MKLFPVLAGGACLLLAACQPQLTLEEAQALCTKQGGLLVVIYSQKITRSGIGPVVASPGDCVSPSRFQKPDAAAAAPPPAAGNPPAPVAPPATAPAPR